MKEFVDIHDYLVSVEVIGDWDGEEELVCEHINEIYHTLYDMSEDDIDTEQLTQLLELIWDHWIGQPALADLETDDIIDWCQHVLTNRAQILEQFEDE